MLGVTITTSFSQDVAPYLRERLAGDGWALVRLEGRTSNLVSDMLNLCTLAGQALAMTTLGYHVFSDDGDSERLVAHTEGISNAEGVTPLFVLGCLIAARHGGQTRVIDGRKAAALVRQDASLTSVEIEYSALANPSAARVYPLVVEEHGGALRYRSRVITNRVVRSDHVSEAEMYRRVDSILECCVSATHSWTVGDMLFVNNLVTLHDRFPFKGTRRMLRVRYNEVAHARMRY